MKNKESKFRFLNISTAMIAGILLLFVTAAFLLWHGNRTSNQAQMALTAQVYFDGEYKIADGPWHKIVNGNHIASTQGDVTLRGNFHMLAPDGEYVGVYKEDIPIAFYLNHINLTILDGENEPFVMDMENPLFGDSVCGVSWTAHTFSTENEGAIEIVVHNPHRFGNETAIDELLASTALWTGIEFEKSISEHEESQRNIGLFLMIVSLLILGSALFSSLIHIKKSRVLWVFGAVVLFAGTYFTYGTDSISLWSEKTVTNTTILGCSMMFYMFFLSAALVQLLKDKKRIFAITAVITAGVFDAIIFIVPIFTNVLFYDMWLYWAVGQVLVNFVLLVCLIGEFLSQKGKTRWIHTGSIMPLLAFALDIIMIDLGIWNTGLASQWVFMVFFVIALIALLRIIPNSINVLAKAKELETEKIVLSAQLTESRVSTMMSQIRPHFIYNTLGSIEQLCVIDPEKAKDLVHNFAKYLRGNFGELDNPKPILMSQEMEHVHHYVSIEHVRFPDMTFLFEMDSNDFHIPALTIQPIVENAIKHGLMRLPKGGTIRVVSYETDTHYCVSVEDDGMGFHTSELQDERKHVGIRNIRERLKAMVGGTLEIESTVGVGTKVLITIPKEGSK